MKISRFIRYPKRGSVILVVVAVFVVLLIILVSFLKSTTSRVHTTKKLGDTMLARELANSLAAVSFHYIKNVELRNEGSKLRSVLSSPMPFKNNNDEEGDLIAGIKSKFKEGEDTSDIISVLLQNSGLNEIKLDELSWKIHKDDFVNLKLGNKKSPYPREKRGVIRVFIKISYKLPGQKTFISEDYVFVTKITVTANLLPVLSKFNLYIGDSFGNNPPPSNEEELISRFNVVSTTAGGKLNSDSPSCPWILNNGCGDSFYESYKDFVDNPKGLVYLGGGSNDKPVVLGIARGFADVGLGDFSEDFHFYKQGTGGYWKTYDVWKTGEGILAAEIGLCDDESTSNLVTWQLMFGEAYKKQSKRNSLFRLFGTDTQKSPTLVLGYVDSMFGQARAYSGSGKSKLAYIDLFEDFVALTTLSSDYDSISAILQSQYAAPLNLKSFALAYCAKNPGFDNSSDDCLKELYKEYKEKYASKVVRTRYTKDYSYMLARDKYPQGNNDIRAYPLEFGNVIKEEDTLRKLCEYKADDIYEIIPSSENVDYAKIYKEVYGNEIKLNQLDKLLNKEILYIDGSNESEFKDRIANSFVIKEAGDDIESFLRFKGLLKSVDGPIMLGGLPDLNFSTGNEDRLDLNGWLFIDCDSDKDLDININTCRPISQGGIIVANKGTGKIDIRIKGFIYGEHITLINLSGNIVIEKDVKMLNASLISSKGHIKLECDSNISNNSKITIRGNMVMNNISKNYIDHYTKRPLYLEYNESLAAIPEQDNPNLEEEKLMRTEFPLLMFDLKENYKMLD